MGTYWPKYSYKIKISDKKLVRMYIKNNLNFKEISDITGIATSTVRRRIIKNGIYPRKGENISDITRKRLAIASTGRTFTMSDNQKKKLSKIAKKRWKGKAKGKTLKPSGYIEITTGRHKFKTEHRVVIEKHLKRKLKKNEVVHHIDGNRQNNNIDNLIVMDSIDHNRLHALENNHKRKRCKKGRYL